MTLIDKFIKSLLPVSLLIFICSVFAIEAVRAENIGLFSISSVIMFIGAFLQIFYYYKK